MRNRFLRGKAIYRILRIIMFAGIGFIVWESTQWIDRQGWEWTEGTVTSSDWSGLFNYTSDYFLKGYGFSKVDQWDVEYTYEVKGSKFHGEGTVQPALVEQRYLIAEKDSIKGYREVVIEKLSGPSKTLVIYYDPENPSDSTPHRGLNIIRFCVIGGGVFLVWVVSRVVKGK